MQAGGHEFFFCPLKADSFLKACSNARGVVPTLPSLAVRLGTQLMQGDPVDSRDDHLWTDLPALRKGVCWARRYREKGPNNPPLLCSPPPTPPPTWEQDPTQFIPATQHSATHKVHKCIALGVLTGLFSLLVMIRPYTLAAQGNHKSSKLFKQPWRELPVYVSTKAMRLVA